MKSREATEKAEELPHGTGLKEMLEMAMKKDETKDFASKASRKLDVSPLLEAKLAYEQLQKAAFDKKALES